MDDSERFRLLGKYKTPRFRLGQKVRCEVRGEVVVCGLSDGPIPWPVGRRGPNKGLVVYKGLAQAVRKESAVAVAHWWGVHRARDPGPDRPRPVGHSARSREGSLAEVTVSIPTTSDRDQSRHPSAVHPGHGDAAVGTLFDDLLAAAEWCCHATMLGAEGQYDGEFEASQRALVSSDDGKMKVTFPEGRRGG
jgi:hypothetical protein